MVCVCVSERKREGKGERLLWLVRQHLSILRSKPNKVKPVALETGFSAVEAASGRSGLRKPRLPGILYLMLITFATGGSVPKPPGRPCYPVLRGSGHATPEPAASAC